MKIFYTITFLLIVHIKMVQQLKMINIEEVECFYSENKGTYLHTLDNRDYLLDNTLEQLETELDPTVILRNQAICLNYG